MGEGKGSFGWALHRKSYFRDALDFMNWRHEILKRAFFLVIARKRGRLGPLQPVWRKALLILAHPLQ
jgi:hypothetical protein